MIAMVTLSSQASSLAQETHPYRTAAAIDLATAMQRPWQPLHGPQPILDWIQQWKSAYSIPVWLDRRVPSDYNIAVRPEVSTVGEAILDVATQIDADVAIIDGVAMVVPQGMAVHIEHAYWSLANAGIPIAWRQRVETVIDWDDGASSRAILERFSAQYGVADFRAEETEHDVWRAGAWQQTSPLVAAIGLLAGVDAQPILQGDSMGVAPIELAAIPEPVSWEYRDEIPRLGKERWQRWRSRWPEVRVQAAEGGSSRRWIILAPVAAHRELVQPLAPAPKATPRADRSQSRFSGRYRGELQSILKNLANQLKLELDLPALPQPVLRQELDVAFEQWSLDQLLEEIGKKSGLKLRVDGTHLRVREP